MRARMLPHTVCLRFRFALAAAAPPCSIHVLSRFALVLPLRACAGWLRRPDFALCTQTPTPVTCVDCPNECSYQFGSRSVTPFGCQCWICSAARMFCRHVQFMYSRNSRSFSRFALARTAAPPRLRAMRTRFP
jgi:hypothetical protein